jgi:hypothetical protein
MRRVNIQVRDEIDPAVAVGRVAKVMADGRVSSDGKYYCWASTFSDGTVVFTRGPGKQFAHSDSFVVCNEKTQDAPCER